MKSGLQRCYAESVPNLNVVYVWKPIWNEDQVRGTVRGIIPWTARAEVVGGPVGRIKRSVLVHHCCSWGDEPSTVRCKETGKVFNKIDIGFKIVTEFFGGHYLKVRKGSEWKVDWRKKQQGNTHKVWEKEEKCSIISLEMCIPQREKIIVLHIPDTRTRNCLIFKYKDDI